MANAVEQPELKEFLLTQWFSLSHGTRLTKMSRIPGDIPLLTAGKLNQGVAEYIGNKDMEIFHNPITVDMFGNSFYHEGDYAGDDNVFFFVNDEISGRAKLFVTSAINAAVHGKHSFDNHQFRMRDAKELKVWLPSGAQGEPDWGYMEQYISRIERDYLQDQIDEGKRVVSLYEEAANLHEGERRSVINEPLIADFLMSDLFAFSSGDVDIQQKDVNGRGSWFVNSGKGNRGIKGRTDRKAKIFPSNTITVDFWGYAFYRDEEYKMATHNHVFSLSGPIIKTREIGIYLTGAMSRFPALFSRDSMATIPKLSELTIQLPVKTNDEGKPVLDPEREYGQQGYIPDWDYMTNYVRQLESTIVQEKRNEWRVRIARIENVISRNTKE